MVVNACKSDHGGLSKTLPPPSLPSSPASFLPGRRRSGGGEAMASPARSAFPAPPPQFWLCSLGGEPAAAAAPGPAPPSQRGGKRSEGGGRRPTRKAWLSFCEPLPVCGGDTPPCNWPACAAWPAHPALKRGWGELYWTGSEEGALFRVHLPLDGVNRAVGGIPRIPFLFVCLFKLFDPVFKV